jgi:hypothetical protein
MLVQHLKNGVRDVLDHLNEALAAPRKVSQVSREDAYAIERAIAALDVKLGLEPNATVRPLDHSGFLVEDSVRKLIKMMGTLARTVVAAQYGVWDPSLGSPLDLHPLRRHMSGWPTSALIRRPDTR